MKKNIVLFALFVLPIVAYLFFASGVTHFGRLPVLNGQVGDLAGMKGEVPLKDHITVLGFLGDNLDNRKGIAFNLNEKIYKRFYEFDNFQFVMVVPEGSEDQVAALKKDLGGLVDIRKWEFVYGDGTRIKALFNSLGTDLSLDGSLGSPYVFILDKEGKLRGRDKDEDGATKYGFDATSVADLNNKMVDDVKIILAEYRLALKRNSAKREK